MFARIKSDLRGWISLIVFSGILFVIMPLALLRGCIDDRNLAKRGKETEGTIITIKGSRENTVFVNYQLKGITYETMRDVPSNRKVRLGEKIKIIYDSLDYENVKIAW